MKSNENIPDRAMTAGEQKISELEDTIRVQKSEIVNLKSKNRDQADEITHLNDEYVRQESMIDDLRPLEDENMFFRNIIERLVK